MGKTITVLSQKGGTGKTTTVRTLCDAFRRVGLRVLAVDMDPQANLTDYLEVGDDPEPTLADVLTGRVAAAAAIHSDVLAGSIHLAEAELMLGGKIGRETVLRRALHDVAPDYDVILVDCPPALGLLTVNALVAADFAMISTEAEYFSLQGVEQALEVVEAARAVNPGLDWIGAVLNIADMRTVHARDAEAQLRERFGDKVFDAVIRRSVAYAESAERATSILDHRPDLGVDYVALAEEVLARIGREADRSRMIDLRARLAPGWPAG